MKVWEREGGRERDWDYGCLLTDSMWSTQLMVDWCGWVVVHESCPPFPMRWREQRAEQRTEAGPKDHSVNHFVLLKPRPQRYNVPLEQRLLYGQD